MDQKHNSENCDTCVDEESTVSASNKCGVEDNGQEDEHVNHDQLVEKLMKNNLEKLKGQHEMGFGMVISSPSPNFEAIASDLQIVLDEIRVWKLTLPVIETEASESKLTKIISAMRMMSGGRSVEEMVEKLTSDLLAETDRRKKLEVEVFDLKSEVARLSVKEADAITTNKMMDVMHLLKNFIIRVEMKTGPYSETFKKFNDKDVVDSLFPEPINIFLDSAEEIAQKDLLLKMRDESTFLFENLGIDSRLVFDLNKKIKSRNASTHFMDNSNTAKLNTTYISDKLSEFETVLCNLDEKSEFESLKSKIQTMVSKMRELHPIAVSMAVAGTAAGKK